MHDTITHADGADDAPPNDRTDLPRTPGRRTGQSRAPSAAGRVEAHGHAHTPSHKGPTLLDPPRSVMAGMAHGLDRRASRYRGPVAPPMAPSAMDPALRTETAGPPRHESSHSHVCQLDHGRESAVGSPPIVFWRTTVSCRNDEPGMSLPYSPLPLEGFAIAGASGFG
jgi:hypothetical protein